MDHEDHSITNADKIRAWSRASTAELDAFGDDGDFARRHLLTPALLDIVDFRRAIANCMAALRPGGTFIFSVEHPFANVVNRRELPFRVRDYFTERARSRAHGHNFHRTLEPYVDAVADCGGLIERIKEPRPAPGVAVRYQQHAWGSHMPAFVVIKARRFEAV